MEYQNRFKSWVFWVEVAVSFIPTAIILFNLSQQQADLIKSVITMIVALITQVAAIGAAANNPQNKKGF